MIRGGVFIGEYRAVRLNSMIFPGAALRRGMWVSRGSVVQGSLTNGRQYGPRMIIQFSTPPEYPGVAIGAEPPPHGRPSRPVTR